jgi:dolichol-phosphate mannosyltransferase
MPEDTATAAPPRPRVTELPVHVRVRQGLRRRHNWEQLVKFTLVGGSGYAVNLVVFALVYKGLDAHHLVAATAAFVVAVVNNFWWNRHWTFGAQGARDHHTGFQAARFFTVSIVAFLFAAAVLEFLVRAGLPAVLAQAISIVAATPLNFVGNKMWTFGIQHRLSRSS